MRESKEPEQAAIDAAHPLKTRDFATYAEAQRLVGARESKGDLVDLVNWLLRFKHEATARLDANSKRIDELERFQNDYDRHLFGLTRAEANAIHERCDVTSLKDGPPELVRAMLKLEGFIAKPVAELVRPSTTPP